MVTGFWCSAAHWINPVLLPIAGRAAMSIGVSEENPRSIASMVDLWNFDRDMVTFTSVH